MAFAVLRMGRKLGLVGTPRIRLGSASTPSGLRQASCHMSTNVRGPLTGENAHGPLTEENARKIENTKDAVRLFGCIIFLWAMAGHCAYKDYCWGKKLDQEDEARKKLIGQPRNKVPELSGMVKLSKD